MVRIIDPLNPKSDQLWLRTKFASTTRKGSMNRTQFIRTESHGIPLICREMEERAKCLCGGRERKLWLACYNSCPRRTNVEPGESSPAVKAGTGSSTKKD